MLEVSPKSNSPIIEWEYPISSGTYDHVMDLDAFFLPYFPTSFSNEDQIQIQAQVQDDDIKHEEYGSRQSASSIDHSISDSILARKVNHNASERDRRKKINGLYSTLRTLLPSTYHPTKKLSVPSTVDEVLKYTPELQKEVEDLIHKKEELLSRISQKGGETKLISQEKKRKKLNKNLKEKLRNLIFVNNLGEREIIIQISTYERISLPEVLLLLEKKGFIIIDVSIFQSFGGNIFYNIHLWMEGISTIICERLNEELLSLIEKHNQVC